MLGWRSRKDNGSHFQPKAKKQISGVKSQVESKGIIKHSFLKRNEFVEIDENNVNDIEATEISLTALSDGDFYHSVVNPNAKNIAKHMLRGDFEKNHMFTKRTFLDHLGKEAIDYYEKEHGTPNDPMNINTDTRRKIGQNIAEKIFDLARDEVRYKNDPKLQFLIAKKTGEREEYLKSKSNISKAMENF